MFIFGLRLFKWTSVKNNVCIKVRVNVCRDVLPTGQGPLLSFSLSWRFLGQHICFTQRQRTLSTRHDVQYVCMYVKVYSRCGEWDKARPDAEHVFILPAPEHHHVDVKPTYCLCAPPLSSSTIDQSVYTMCSVCTRMVVDCRESDLLWARDGCGVVVFGWHDIKKMKLRSCGDNVTVL